MTISTSEKMFILVAKILKVVVYGHANIVVRLPVQFFFNSKIAEVVSSILIFTAYFFTKAWTDLTSPPKKHIKSIMCIPSPAIAPPGLSFLFARQNFFL